MNFIEKFITSTRISGLQYVFFLYLPYYVIYDYEHVDTIYLILSINGFINGMLFNNFFDYDIDVRYRPDKIGFDSIGLQYLITLSSAFHVMMISYLNSIDTSSILTYGAFSSWVLSTSYTPFFKRIPLIKNIVTSLYMTYIPIFSIVYFKSDIETALTFAIPTTFFVFIREIMLDLNDTVEDIANNIQTIPVLLGENATINLLKYFIRFYWILSLYFYKNSAIICGMISLLSSYAYCRVYYIENRELMFAIMLFHILFPIVAIDFNIYKGIGLFSIMLFINYIISVNDCEEIWEVFSRKMFHIMSGCMLLEMNQNIVMTLLTLVFSLNIIFPKISLGIEKRRDESLLDDVGVRSWLVIVFCYTFMSDADNYVNLLPFFISDPVGAIVGRNTPIRDKVIIWANEKSLQGTFMIFATCFAISNSIILSTLVLFAELFGGEYDDFLIGICIILSYPFQIGLNRLPELV
jgi:4-hydroxybenzoate polyprenyltransferase